MADVNNIMIDVRSIFKANANPEADTKDNPVIDRDWVKSRFMVPNEYLPKEIRNIRYDSIASLKFVDTTLGGNTYINPRPQFNPLTDPKVENPAMDYQRPTMNPDQANTGMGEGYSKMIDDNQQVVYMEFGLPKFNSLINFFFRAVDYGDSVLANTGRPATFYHIGKYVGTALALVAFPIITITVSVLKFAVWASSGSDALKFYYFSSHMPMYWGMVNTLVTQLVTEQGLLVPLLMPDGQSRGAGNAAPSVDKIGVPYKLNQADIDTLNEMIPNLIHPNTNYIDVYALINRSQRAASIQRENVYNLLNKNPGTPKSRALAAKLPKTTSLDVVDRALTFQTYVNAYNDIMGDSRGDAAPVKAASAPTATTTGGKPPLVAANGVTVNQMTSATDVNSVFKKDPDGRYSVPHDKAGVTMASQLANSFHDSARQGGAFAAFGVEYTGSSSESFSNTTTSINLGDQAKEISSKSRSLSYDMARGNMFGDTIVQDGLNMLGDVFRGLITGGTLGLTNVLASLAGNAYIEVPKRWDDSSMSLPSNTYKMSLISPYNTFYSQLENIYIPLCMLLAGVLPMATGKSSYTSPFLCTLFSRGVESVKLGMITSVSITRGTSNLGFDKKHKPLAIDVSFKVTDFSTLVTTPVNSSIFNDVFRPSIDDDTPLGNYIAMLGGRDIMTSKYRATQSFIRISREFMALNKAVSANRVGMYFGDMVGQTPFGWMLSKRSMGVLQLK